MYAPWLYSSTRSRHTKQMFADHFGPRKTIQKPLIKACCNNHKESCTLFRPYLTIAAAINTSSFVRVSTRQLSSEFLVQWNFRHTQIYASIDMTGLELATSLTQSERRIEWTNLTAWCVYEELISKTSYIHSYMLLICRSGHSKEANFQHEIYCKWKMLILIEILNRRYQKFKFYNCNDCFLTLS